MAGSTSAEGVSASILPLLWHRSHAPSLPVPESAAPLRTAASTRPTSSGPPAPSVGFPTRTSVGVPAGWTPTRTIDGNYTVTTPGAVVQDLRINDFFNRRAQRDGAAC